MPVVVKTKLTLKQLPNDIKKNFSRDLKASIGDKIVERILSGKSPVKGKRFKQYSTEYAKKKGRRAPVDMLVSGKMLESIVVKQNRIGQVIISFKDGIAKFHDIMGAGKSKVIRRLLPRTGEAFAPPLWRFILKTLNKATKKATTKQR